MAASVSKEPESEREMVVSRIIAGPPHLVFRAFTEARHLAHWFGPNGFRLTIHAFSFQVGGVWDFIMHGPDGTDYPNWVRWQEILPNQRLVYEHGARANDPDGFETTITFTERNGQTEVTLRALLKTKAHMEQVMKRYNALEGGKQTLGRLAAYADELTKAGG